MEENVEDNDDVGEKVVNVFNQKCVICLERDID